MCVYGKLMVVLIHYLYGTHTHTTHTHTHSVSHSGWETNTRERLFGNNVSKLFPNSLQTMFPSVERGRRWLYCLHRHRHSPYMWQDKVCVCLLPHHGRPPREPEGGSTLVASSSVVEMSGWRSKRLATYTLLGASASCLHYIRLSVCPSISSRCKCSQGRGVLLCMTAYRPDAVIVQDSQRRFASYDW